MTAIAEALDPFVARVSEMPDDELQDCADNVERALIHFLVEQQMRASASVSPLRAV